MHQQIEFGISICMCSPQHISKEANLWQKYEGIIQGVGIKGIGIRSVLERRGWRGKRVEWEKLTGCKMYAQCRCCNCSDRNCECNCCNIVFNYNKLLK